ncbi:MAG: class I SAM-dependent RNA methyltransferase [Acidobacteria bacterium]|nr:MAG: class I SAM-dependent RNA methyltransferase [Acidobacteriota bacterium]
MSGSRSNRPPRRPGRGGPRRRPPTPFRRRRRDRERTPPPPVRPPASGPPPPGVKLIEVDEIEVEIEKLVAGGDGLARYEGIPIFVPRAAPGDRLRVRVVERRPDYGRAEIVDLLHPGPGRRTPPCPHFARCGGCDLQHLEDEHQLRLKVAAVRETLARIGKVDAPPRVQVVAGDPWQYRLRAQLHAESTERGIEVGYLERRSHRLVPVEDCPVLVPELEALLPRLPRALRDEPRKRIDLTAGDGGAITCAPLIPGLPHGPVSLRAGDFTYRYDARCFFQAHRQLLASLIEHAVGPWEGEKAYDLYAGVGLFSLPLAARYGAVVAVEGDRIAARYARINARHNRVANLTVDNRSVESFAASLPERPPRVMVDPPRAGLSAPVRRALLACRPQRLTYVSCHAATLARDLRILHRVLELERLVLLDLFPQTGHLEVVAQLTARPADAQSPEAQGAEERRPRAGGRRRSEG